MKVGIIGSGVVGQTLAPGFLKHGHQVEIGASDPAKLKDWSAKNPGVKVKSFAEVAAFGDVVVLTVAGQSAGRAARLDPCSAAAIGRLIEATSARRRSTESRLPITTVIRLLKS
jgi:8-hydroxy-5-deazaflavin:NADPH oxidoreductase